MAGDLASGRVAGRNCLKSQKAIFLDRDGMVNEHMGFLRSPEEFGLLPDVAEAVCGINGSGYFAIVVANQPS